MTNKKKKIGTLTFSFSSNPGSVLQAYALQNVLEQLGYDASIINYQKTSADKPVWGQNVFYPPISKWTPSKLLDWINRIVAYPVRMRKYLAFFKKYYNDYTEKSCSKEELAVIEKKYDKFIVGSDQVWNLDSINVDYTYFLDFVSDNSKKVSYAASFGQKGVPDDKREEVISLLKGFSAISVREQDGVSTVHELIGKNAEWVVDPSLLIDEKVWHSMAEAPAEKDYVFLYLRESSKRLEAYANDLAKKFNLKVIKVVVHWKYNEKGKKVGAVGPLEWLGYMKHARYIVTNSFHGICFSLAFEKEFVVDMLKAGRSSTNPRIVGLLEQFELHDRFIDSYISETRVLDEPAVPKSIDYESVNKIKQSRRQQSLDYLKKSIEGECTNDQ